MCVVIGGASLLEYKENIQTIFKLKIMDSNYSCVKWLIDFSCDVGT